MQIKIFIYFTLTLTLIIQNSIYSREVTQEFKVDSLLKLKDAKAKEIYTEVIDRIELNANLKDYHSKLYNTLKSDNVNNDSLSLFFNKLNSKEQLINEIKKAQSKNIEHVYFKKGFNDKELLIDEVVFKELAKIKSLKHLYIFNAEVKLPKSMKEFKNLVSFNIVTSYSLTLNTSFEKNNHLLLLSLYSSKSMDLGKSFELPSSLLKLNISGISDNQIISKTFDNLAELRYLSLSGNAISSKANFSKLTNLEYVILYLPLLENFFNEKGSTKSNLKYANVQLHNSIEFPEFINVADSLEFFEINTRAEKIKLNSFPVLYYFKPGGCIRSIEINEKSNVYILHLDYLFELEDIGLLSNLTRIIYIYIDFLDHEYIQPEERESIEIFAKNWEIKPDNNLKLYVNDLRFFDFENKSLWDKFSLVNEIYIMSASYIYRNSQKVIYNEIKQHLKNIKN